MKKLNVLLVIGMLAMGITGCGKAASVDAPDSNGTVSSGQPEIGNSHPADRTTAFYEVNSIIVNSSETVTVVPDIAEVVYSVRTQAKDAAECQQKNSEAVGKVIELLKGLAVSETSIQTSDYYMNPIYDYSGNTTRVTGYEAITTLTVSDLPIEGLENILSQSVSTGINTIQSITYQASKYDESYRQALANAVTAAHEKAKVLAEAAGCNVGAVINIQETSGYSEARYTDNALSNQYKSAAKVESLRAMEDTANAIEPGEIQVEASIVVEYQLY